MPTRKMTKEEYLGTIAVVEEKLRAGYPPTGKGIQPTAIDATAQELNMPAATVSSRLSKAKSRYNITPDWRIWQPTASPSAPSPPPRVETPERPPLADAIKALLNSPRTIGYLADATKATLGDVLTALDELSARGVNVHRVGDIVEIPRTTRQSWTKGAALELVSRPDNTFCFGAFGDLHAASKYTRWDVREDLVRRSEDAGAQAIFDTGNWIDGEAKFNLYDIVAHGLEAQCRLLAEKHPKTALPIYAVTGDDHEGWYSQREGIDVGSYCAGIMQASGHDWHDLGFMEAHVTLRNANSGAAVQMAVVHPGGGSAYALSYSIQKIVESYEGGEKPAVGLYGHYHKLWAGIIRNVWCVQTGCQQDQTPFMRKKRLEAHVGGTIIELEQEPESGAIIAMTPKILRYFNTGFYEAGNRWSRHGPTQQPPRTLSGV